MVRQTPCVCLRQGQQQGEDSGDEGGQRREMPMPCLTQQVILLCLCSRNPISCLWCM